VSDTIEMQFQTMIEEAKGLKASLEMTKLDYRHTMKKLTIMAEQYPSLAAKYGLTKTESKTEE
jgi:hypothetical protein